MAAGGFIKLHQTSFDLHPVDVIQIWAHCNPKDTVDWIKQIIAIILFDLFHRVQFTSHWPDEKGGALSLPT